MYGRISHFRLNHQEINEILSLLVVEKNHLLKHCPYCNFLGIILTMRTIYIYLDLQMRRMIL